jgi:hypothetical protein
VRMVLVGWTAGYRNALAAVREIRYLLLINNSGLTAPSLNY